MYYAADGIVSTDPIEGGIEISFEQYAQAVEAKMNGDDIGIEGGFHIVPKPEPDPAPEIDPEDPDAPYFLYKTTIWERMTDPEIEVVYGAMQQQPIRLRMIWADALTVQSSSPFFADLHAFLSAVLSPERADAILAK